MTRRIQLALLVFACASSGCLRLTTTIDLRPDGSGTILQETSISNRAIETINSFADQADKAPPEFLTGEAARQAAATMGVTFVSGEPYTTADLKGYRARYAFDDISKVILNLDPSGWIFGFTFDRRPTSSILTIQMAQGKSGGDFLGLGAGGEAPGSAADKAEADQAMAMIAAMLKGMFIDVSLRVNGRILKSNAPYVQGSRVTLMQLDFDKLLADKTALRKLQSAPDISGLSGLPGLKIVKGPKVTIEFRR